MIHSLVQSILFNRNIWTKDMAEKWLKKYDFHPIKKAHVTKNYLRYRLHSPNKKGHYVTHELHDGILFVIKY